MHEVKKRIIAAWNRFLQDPGGDNPDVRPVILDSWRRSRAAGVDSFNVRKTVIAPDELQRKIQQNRQLYDTAAPIVEKLYEFVKGTGFCTILSDRHGTVLKVYGDENSVDAAESNLLIEGADRAESAIGTNAIGTVIHTREPLQVWADEHYYKPNSVWSCSGAPIFAPDGELAGVLCLSGNWESVHFHTPGMAVSGSPAVSKQLERPQPLVAPANTRRQLDKVV